LAWSNIAPEWWAVAVAATAHSASPQMLGFIAPPNARLRADD
jgi:hypothetical protein